MKVVPWTSATQIREIRVFVNIGADPVIRGFSDFDGHVLLLWVVVQDFYWCGEVRKLTPHIGVGDIESVVSIFTFVFMGLGFIFCSVLLLRHHIE